MATKLVKTGQSHRLGIVIDPNTPAFPPRGLMLQVVQPNQQGGQRLHGFGYAGSYNDDVAQLWLGIGPQFDRLGHLVENVKAASKSQGIEIRKGNVVLFHTGSTDNKLNAEPKHGVLKRYHQ